MATSEIHLITVSCDVPACDHTIPCGADPEHARKEGWQRISVLNPDQPVDDQSPELRDLCPSCYADLTDFLYGPPQIIGEKAEDSQ